MCCPCSPEISLKNAISFSSELVSFKFLLVPSSKKNGNQTLCKFSTHALMKSAWMTHLPKVQTDKPYMPKHGCNSHFANSYAHYMDTNKTLTMRENHSTVGLQHILGHHAAFRSFRSCRHAVALRPKISGGIVT